MKALKQLLKEAGLPLAAALAWTLYNVLWAPAPRDGWTFASTVNLFGPSFFFAAWAFGQWFRVRKQQHVEAGLSSIQAKVQSMLDDLDTKTTNLIGHVTGGNSSPYLKIAPSGGANPFGAALVTVIGNYSLREVTLKIECTSPFQANLGSYELGTVPFGHARQLPSVPLSLQQYEAFSFKLTFSALNGTTTQLLRFQRVNGQWLFATGVAGHGVIVHRESQPGFANPPDWEQEMRLAGVELGGKPYNPLV